MTGSWVLLQLGEEGFWYRIIKCKWQSLVIGRGPCFGGQVREDIIRVVSELWLADVDGTDYVDLYGVLKNDTVFCEEAFNGESSCGWFILLFGIKKRFALYGTCSYFIIGIGILNHAVNVLAIIDTKVMNRGFLPEILGIFSCTE